MKTEGKETTGLIALFVLALFIMLEVRLFQLQVLGGREYKRLSDDNRLNIERVPAPRGVIFDRNGVPLVKNSPFFCLVLLPEMTDRADLDAIAAFIGLEKAEILRRIEKRAVMFDPVILKEGLSFSEVAFYEARLVDYPGLTVIADSKRDYIYGETAAHLIGYLGILTPSQAADPAFNDVPRQAFIGQWGVERLYDRTLRGMPGKRVIEVDALGRQLSLLFEEPPRKGEDIYLSIDLNLQRAAEEAFGDRAGALVALKPTTGEVLGLVSKPSFDPNVFSRGIAPEDWLKLQTGEKFPMLNRALQSQFPPGSTFKIITGIAALEEGVIEPGTTFTCTGGLNTGRLNFGCWRRGGHGVLGFHKGLVQSCDVYFYNAGKKAEIDAIAKYARMFGLGKETGIPIVMERTGLIPDTGWKLRVKNEQWYVGETYNASIGQGYVLATPAQMARMISAVSNGGYLYEMSLTRMDSAPIPLEKIGVNDLTLKEIKDALRGVVTEPGGTGHAANSNLVSIGGKTGTAQVISGGRGGDKEKFKDHAWFVAYAPAESPEVALSVFVEHGGHGGVAAAPVARRAIEAYLSPGGKAPPWEPAFQETRDED